MPAKAPTKTGAPDESNPVSQWRWDQALRMGCDPALADQVALHHEVDLHQLKAMISGAAGRRPCPPEIAFDILRG